MYLSNQTCPDCKYTMHVTCSWPAVIPGEPTILTFVCQNCALMQRLEGYAVKKPFEQDIIITPTGRNVLERHHDAYNKMLPYMQGERFTVV